MKFTIFIYLFIIIFIEVIFHDLLLFIEIIKITLKKIIKTMKSNFLAIFFFFNVVLLFFKTSRQLLVFTVFSGLFKVIK